MWSKVLRFRLSVRPEDEEVRVISLEKEDEEDIVAGGVEYMGCVWRCEI